MQTILDFNEARDDEVAATTAGPYVYHFKSYNSTTKNYILWQHSMKTKFQTDANSLILISDTSTHLSHIHSYTAHTTVLMAIRIVFSCRLLYYGTIFVHTSNAL